MSLIGSINAARAERDRVAGVIAHCLHEPMSRARALTDAARRNEHRWGRQTRRLLARLASRRSHRIELTSTERARLAAFGAYLREEERPKLLLGLHFGNFLNDLIKMLDAAPRGTRVYAPVPARSLAALGPVVDYARATDIELALLPLKANLALALRRARERRDVVLMLADLGASHGQTSATTLFGVAVQLVAGPYAIARLLGAPLVLVRSEAGHRVHELDFDAPDETSTDRRIDVATLVERYARRAERVIARAPTHWLRWPRFHELLPIERIDAAAPPDGDR